MIHVNVYGDIHPTVWERQSLSLDNQDFQFHYREHPRKSDWSVYIGNAGFDFSPNKSKNQVFIVVEPPEIHIYEREFLQKFTHVVGPCFREYESLPNYFYSNACLPWSVGLSFQDTKSDIKSKLVGKLPSRFQKLFYEPPAITHSVSEILADNFDKQKFLSIVTSDKADTPMQKQRLAFIQYLQKKRSLPLQIYGRGYLPIRDKFDVLSRSTHHIALENSSHKGNWTEKLSDSILTLNKTYYAGAPGINDYFSPEVVQAIDLSDFEKAEIEILSDFERNLPDVGEILEARRKLVFELSFEPILKKMISNQFNFGID